MNLSPLFLLAITNSLLSYFFDNLYPVYYQKKDKYTSYELLNIFCKLQMNKKIIFATFLALSTNYYEIYNGKTIKLLTKQTTLL